MVRPRPAALLAVFALLPAGLAHGPGIEVTRARLMSTAEGSFLELGLDAPDVGERHDLIAVSTRFGAGAFKHEQAGGYRPVEVIPVEAGPQRYGEATAYRIRLPRPARGATEVPLTLMFSAGELVHTEMTALPTSGGRWPERMWYPISALLLGATLWAALPLLLRWRRAVS